MTLYLTIHYSNGTVQSLATADLQKYNDTHRKFGIRRNVDWYKDEKLQVAMVSLHANLSFSGKNYSVIAQWSPECQYKVIRVPKIPENYTNRIDIIPQDINYCRAFNFSVDPKHIVTKIRRNGQHSDDPMLFSIVDNFVIRFETEEI